MASRRSKSESLLVALATALLAVVCVFLGLHAEPAAAEDELTPRFEAAFADAGFACFPEKYDPAVIAVDGARAEAWDLRVYGQVGTQARARTHVLIWRFESAQLADSMLAAKAPSSAPEVSIDGASGRVDVRPAVSPVGDPLGYDTVTVWWARDNCFVQMGDSETDKNTQLALALIIDDVLSGKSGTTVTAPPSTETTLPPMEPGLSASASPGAFTALGDSATIQVILTGAEVEGKTVSLAGHGLESSATTNAAGEASFPVAHNDETLGEYRFTITSEGMTREVVIPVSALDVHTELEPISGKPYAGVVADGRSTLLIQIALSANLDGTLRAVAPDLGTLRGNALGSDDAIALTGGTATIEYVPPPYLEGARLTERVPLPEYSGPTISSARAAQTVYANGGRPWAATVPLTFIRTDPAGKETKTTLDLFVTRPPVMLVHGFIGGKVTWAQLQTFLAGQRFDAVINEYYMGDQGVHDQARALGTDIAREVARYGSLGLKASRVDVVAHSMGGLISRDYAYGLPPHPADVRKIIMVATPNHGADFLYKSLGNLMADLSAKHSLASEQLYSGSAFLAQLNAGEAVGRHLNPDVQYGNIYGVRTDYVVPGTSAYLNGVASHIMSGVTHSPAIPLPGDPITTSATVFGWVVEWLGTEIPRAPLRDTKVQVTSGAGSVYISGLEASGETHVDVVSFPHDVQPWEQVGTGPDSRATIRLSVGAMVWGTINLAPDSLIALGNLTPSALSVRVRRGSARFSSLERGGGGHFEVVIGETDPGHWTTLRPDAKVIGLDTDFVAAAGADGVAEVLVLKGRVLFGDGATAAEDDMLTLGRAQAGAVGVAPGFESQLARQQWWTDGFYRLSFVETLREWWTIVKSRF